MATINFPISPIARTSDGWTDFKPSADSKLIYVSQSGNDANPGTIDKPVKTPKAAQALVRNGSADWVLFKRGEKFDAIGQWNKSGRSLKEPVVITSYGTGARPQVGPITSWQTWQKPTRNIVNFVAVVGLHIIGDEKRNVNLPGWNKSWLSQATVLCIGWNADGDGFHVEDCKLEWGTSGVEILGQLKNFIFRRNIVANNYPNGSKGQGMYVANYGNNENVHPPFTVEENTFYYNGYRDVMNNKSMFSHHLYVSSHGGPCKFSGNFLYKTACTGAQLRGGGVFEDNIILQSPYAGFVSVMQDAPDQASIIQNNVVEFGEEVGIGLEVNRAKVCLVKNNIVTHKDAVVGGSPAYNVNVTSTKPWTTGGPPVVPPRNASITFENNVAWNWSNLTFWIAGDTTITLNGNNLGGDNDKVNEVLNFPSSLGTIKFGSPNKYFSVKGAGKEFRIGSPFFGFPAWKQKTGDNGSIAKPVFPDVNKSAKSYAKSFGFNTLDEFTNELLKQQKGNWRLQLTANSINNYIREGFGLPKVGGTPASSSSSSSVKPSSSSSSSSSSAVSNNPKVIKAVIRDLTTNQDVRELKDGDILNPADLPEKMTIHIVCEKESSVKVSLDNSPERLERTPPYALLGDSTDVNLSEGQHVLKAQAFQNDDGTGLSSPVFIVNFTVQPVQQVVIQSVIIESSDGGSVVISPKPGETFTSVKVLMSDGTVTEV